MSNKLHNGEFQRENFIYYLLSIIGIIGSRIHRYVDPIGHARKIGVQVGTDCRLIGVSFGSEPYLIKMGNHVSISWATFINHDGGVWVLGAKHPEIDVVKSITIGDNVFIGHGSIIMPGVTIGNNVVIGAGSVVTKDIPNGVVAAGVPAKAIKTLDEYEQGLLPNARNTKGLSAAEKKKYYLSVFPENRSVAK